MNCDMCADKISGKPYLAIVCDVETSTCSAECHTRLREVWNAQGLSMWEKFLIFTGRM